MRTKIILIIALVVFTAMLIYSVNHQSENEIGQRSPLPLPSTLPLQAFETELYAFLENRMAIAGVLEHRPETGVGILAVRYVLEQPNFAAV